MRRPHSGEGGFTLSEVMVTIAIMLVVMFALYSVFDITLKSLAFGRQGVEATQNARLGLERMQREIQAAYPYDRSAAPPDPRLLEVMTPPRIAFGNDRGAGDRRIDPATERISYALSATGPPYTLTRTVGDGSAQPVVENVGVFESGAPGLRFEYLRIDGGAPVQTAVEAEVDAVRITLVMDSDGRRQELSTVAALRNRAAR